LTKSFGTPSYGEIDPTILMSITFPIFFGLMFGDIGHGLLLLVVAILGLIGKRKNVDLGEIGNYIIKGSTLLLCILNILWNPLRRVFRFFNLPRRMVRARHWTTAKLPEKYPSIHLHTLRFR